MQVGRQVVETQHGLELDLGPGIVAEGEIGAAQAQVGVDRIRGRRQAPLKKRQRLVRAVGLQRGPAEQRVEYGVALAGLCEGREQVVGLRIAALAQELLGAGQIGIGGRRPIRQDQAHSDDQRTPAGTAAWTLAPGVFASNWYLTVSSLLSPLPEVLSAGALEYPQLELRYNGQYVIKNIGLYFFVTNKPGFERESIHFNGNTR